MLRLVMLVRFVWSMRLIRLVGLLKFLSLVRL